LPILGGPRIRADLPIHGGWPIRAAPWIPAGRWTRGDRWTRGGRWTRDSVALAVERPGTAGFGTLSGLAQGAATATCCES